MSHWICIEKTPHRSEIDIWGAKLEASDIPFVLVNKQDSMYTIGYFELHVMNEQAAEALAIIKDEYQSQTF